MVESIGLSLSRSVLRGSADLADRHKALIDAIVVVHQQCQGGDTALALSDSQSLCESLLELLDPNGRGDISLTLTRGAGKPVDWQERCAAARAEDRAARLVEFLHARGRQKTWAVLHVAARKQSPISRKRIYEALSRRDRARAILPDADQDQLWSLILLMI